MKFPGAVQGESTARGEAPSPDLDGEPGRVEKALRACCGPRAALIPIASIRSAACPHFVENTCSPARGISPGPDGSVTRGLRGAGCRDVGTSSRVVGKAAYFHSGGGPLGPFSAGIGAEGASDMIISGV